MFFGVWDARLCVEAKRSSQVEARATIITSWVYDRTIPPSVLTNIECVQSSNPHFTVQVFCGTDICLKNIAKINNPQIKGKFLRIHELFNETPLFKWQQQHILHKMLMGQSFEEHLQFATQLSILWKFGGIYMSPKLSCSSLKNIAPAHFSSWTTQPLSTDRDSNVMDLVYFKDHHPLVWELMELFLEKYHVPLQKDIFKFNFAPLAKEHISHCTGRIVDFTCIQNYSPQETEEHFGVLVVAKGNIGDEMQSFA